MNVVAQQLSDLLSLYSGLKVAILFGSQASGMASPKSDIDLALLFDEPMSSELRVELIELIGRKFGRPVDIVDMYHAPEPILGQVFKGVRLIGDNASYANILSKHLLNAADFLPLRERILAERRHAWIS